MSDTNTDENNENNDEQSENKECEAEEGDKLEMNNETDDESRVISDTEQEISDSLMMDSDKMIIRRDQCALEELREEFDVSTTAPGIGVNIDGGLSLVDVSNCDHDFDWDDIHDRMGEVVNSSDTELDAEKMFPELDVAEYEEIDVENTFVDRKKVSSSAVEMGYLDSELVKNEGKGIGDVFDTCNDGEAEFECLTDALRKYDSSELYIAKRNEWSLNPTYVLKWKSDKMYSMKYDTSGVVVYVFDEFTEELRGLLGEVGVKVRDETYTLWE